MAHSNQLREYVITNNGIKLLDAYIGPEGVLTGSSRIIQESKDKSKKSELLQEIKNKKLYLEHKRKAYKSQIDSLNSQFNIEEINVLNEINKLEEINKGIDKDQLEMTIARQPQNKNSEPKKQKNEILQKLIKGE